MAVKAKDVDSDTCLSSDYELSSISDDNDSDYEGIDLSDDSEPDLENDINQE